ncbi:MAG: YlbF family regulator [Chloroflexi bacterium]|nr:YlbF family regulator [Chloroflexota bacterium]
MSMSAAQVPTAEAVEGEDVLAAARAFAQALGEAPEYRAYEESADRLRNDRVAQQAMAEFTAKERSLQMLLILNAVPAEERAELSRLREAFFSQPAVVGALKAQDDLTALCRAAADLLSQRIGLSFAAACGPGCC